MFSFIFAMAICNMIGGRWGDLVGEDNKGAGRLIFRCIVPGVLASALAWNGDWQHIAWVWFSVTAGSALWFVPGWSFDEITGQFSRDKYQAWVRAIGLRFYPDTGDYEEATRRNYKRGVIMKGIRGGYDILTFILLSAVNPWALIWWPMTFLQGVVYLACGKINQKYSVILAEFIWGAVRGALIFLAIGG